MKEIPVVLFGAGGVGRALLDQVVDTRETLATRNQMRFSVVAVADSRTWVFDPSGLSDEQLQAINQAKHSGDPMPGAQSRPNPADLIDEVYAGGVRGAIIVDVTAVDGLEPMLNKALSIGYKVAMANKKAMAGPWETAEAFYNNAAVRHESTVGGGQPVIATMRYLMDIKDDVFEVEGQLSGTLGYLCQQLDNETLFSQAVGDAKSLGFTEPDPREDLGGQDVMRKLMILARMAGWPLEAADIEVESLYPAELADCSVAEFMERIEIIDAEMATRFAEAKANGEVLRYIGKVSAEGGKVGLLPVDAASPLANLKYISYRTGLYDDEPLMICGKGAGVEMTAGGVLGDMIALGREQL